MLSILVGHSYFLRFDQKQRRRAKPYPPLATLQVAALLREGGHEVALFDAMLAEDIERLRGHARRPAAATRAVLRGQLQFPEQDVPRHDARGLLRHDRAARARAGARVIAAGSDASDAPGAYLNAGADAVLHGEGARRRSARSSSRLNREPRPTRRRNWSPACRTSVTSAGGGRARRRSGAAARCRSSPQLARLGSGRHREIPRACGAKRTAISVSTWPPRAAARSAATGARSPSGAISICSARRATSAAEMLHLKRHYAPDHVWFADDIFGFRADWVNEFARRAGRRRRRRAVHDPAARGSREPAHGATRCARPAAGKCGSAPRAAARRSSTP